MNRFFKWLHLWLSVPAGVFIIILCLTGSVLLFQQEIQQAGNPAFYKVDRDVCVNMDKASFGSIVSLAESEALSDGRNLTSLTFYSDPSRTVEMSVSGGRGVYGTLDPYQLVSTETSAPFTEFFTKVRGLHRWLLLDGDGIMGRKSGRFLMGLSTILFTVILVTGIVISFRGKGTFRKAFAVKKGGNPFLLWFTSHRALGLYMVVFLLLMTLTGPVWSFGWYRDAAKAVFAGSGTDGRNARTAAVHNSSIREEPLTEAWTKALDHVAETVPDYRKLTVKNGSVTVQRKGHHYRAGDVYRFDRDGNIVGVDYYVDKPASAKFMGYVYILHTGKWGGYLVRLLYLFAVITGVYLVVSGYVLWIGRWVRKRHAANCI